MAFFPEIGNLIFVHFKFHLMSFIFPLMAFMFPQNSSYFLQFSLSSLSFLLKIKKNSAFWEKFNKSIRGFFFVILGG